MTCKNCGAELVENAKFCGACGMENSEENKNVRCNKCDKEFSAVWGMCPHCGNEDISQFQHIENVNQAISSNITDDIHISSNECAKINAQKLQKIGKTLFFAKFAFYIVGIVVIVVLLALNPKMHKTEIRPIEFCEYSQDLSVGDRCKIDVKTAEYITSIEQKAGQTAIGTQHYYMVQDRNGQIGIVMFDGIYDVEEFQNAILENKDESIKFLGEIKEAPESILPDVEAMIESDNAGQDYDSAYEETKAVEELLSKHKIMGIDFDMPSEEKVTTGMGTGTYLLLCVIACFMVGHICSRASKKQYEKARSAQ